MNHTTALAPARGLSPKTVARLIALFTLLTVCGGVYAQGYVAEELIAWRDATTTASNFLAHRNLALSGFAVYLIEMVCNVVSTVLLYVLLKPAGRTLALTALALGLIACCIKTMARVFFAAPLLVLSSTYVQSLAPEVRNDLALLFLLVNDRTAGMAMVFFGCFALLEGILILRSTFLPRFLGWVAILGGIGWLSNLWRPLWSQVGNYVLLVALLGVAVKVSWFLARGVNEQRWLEQARSSR